MSWSKPVPATIDPRDAWTQNLDTDNCIATQELGSSATRHHRESSCMFWEFSNVPPWAMHKCTASHVELAMDFKQEVVDAMRTRCNASTLSLDVKQVP